MLKKFHRKQAFTLIELLIVVAIISILAAILFPVFARARESARRTSCLSNMKQIGTAWLMYAQDYDEKAVLAVHYDSSTGDEIAWDFRLDWSEVDYSDPNPTPKASAGLLDSYAKNGQIHSCPSFYGEAWGRPHTGYAYNTTYIGGEGPWGGGPLMRESVHLAAITDAAGTAIFAEGGYGNPVNAQNYLRAPSDPYNSVGKVHFRHNGTANVAYADGHVKNVTRKFNFRAAEPDVGDLSADDSAYDLK